MRKVIVIMFFIGSIGLSSGVLAQSNIVSIDSSIERAQNFLIRQVLEDHYEMACQSEGRVPCPLQQTGKVFSSYFIVQALKKEAPLAVRQKIIRDLMQEKREDLWGYARHAKLDADDTSFVLQTLKELQDVESPTRLSRFFKNTIHSYTTFLNPADDVGPAIVPSEQNNLAIHPEVIANIYQLFYSEHLAQQINFSLIQKNQAKAGFWHTYFYPGRYYSTYFNLKLLCEAHIMPKALLHGLNFIVRTQQVDGSWGDAYDTALALNTLLACHYPNRQPLIKAVHYLLSQQNQNGAWASSQIIWQYVYQDRPLIIWSGKDPEHVVTTALSVQALLQFKRQVHF